MAAIAAIAAAKKHNGEMEARRRAAEQERARRWAEADRLQAQEQKASGVAAELIEEISEVERPRAPLAVLGELEPEYPRAAAFIRWAAERLARVEAQLTRETIEERLAQAGLLASEETDADE